MQHEIDESAGPSSPRVAGDAAPSIRGEKSRGWIFAVLVFAVAAAVRFLYLYQSADNPTFSNPVVDAQAYDTLARQLVAGESLKDLYWQPVFYPLFLAFVYFLSNSSIVWAKIVQLLLGCFTCALTYRLGDRVFGRACGLVAGLILACYGPVVFFESDLVASGWAAFWSVALMLLLLNAARRGSARTAFWLGVCGLLAILTRPTFAIFLAAGCCWLLVKYAMMRDRWRVILRCVPALIAGAVIVYVPFAKLNERATGRFSIMPTSGGINVYIGNNADTCKTLTIRPGLRWKELNALPERNGVQPELWKKQAYFYGLVREYANSDPFGYARGLAGKAVQFASSREIPRNVDVYLFRRWSSLLSALVWKVWGFGFPFGLLLPLAVIGLIWNLRRTPLPVLFWVVLFPAAVVLVFVAGRYRVAVIPMLAMLASAGVFSLVGFVRAGAWGRVGASVAVMAAVVLIATVPGPFCAEKPNYEAELYYVLGTNASNAGKTDEAKACFERTLEIDPEFADAHNNLGAEYYERGQYDEAINHFSRAAEIQIDGEDTFYNLGAAYYKRGDINDAIRNWLRVIELNPSNVTARYHLGSVLLEQKRSEEAAEQFREAVRYKPDFKAAVTNLGVALERMGHAEEAVPQYERAIELDPNDALPRDNLIKVLNKLERYEEALAACQDAIRLAPNNAEWRYQCGRALEGLGRTSDAVLLYRQALQINPSHQAARERLTEIAGQE